MRVRATNANGDGPWSDEVRQNPTKPDLTASSITYATATLSISNHANAPWWYKGDQSGATCTSVAKGTASADVSGLDGSTDYTYTAYYDDDCGSSSKHDDVAFTTAAAPTLAGSSVTHNSATLTISNYSGNWHYKYTSPTGGTCSTNAVSTTTKDVTGLDSNTSYTYKAYSDSSCNTELAAASAFLTKPGKPTKPTATASAGSGKLTLSSSVTGSGAISKWQYQQKKETDNAFGSWQDITTATSTTLSYTVTGLTDGTNYQFKVRAVNATGDGVASNASVAAAPVDETLAASSVTHNSATLTIGNHSGDWYYKANAAPDNTCKGPVSTTTKNLTGLSGNTSYTYKAYSNSSCSSELAAASAFLTKPGKPTKPTAASGAGSGKLTITASVTGSGTLTGWQYRQKKESDNTFGDWQNISSTSTSLSHTVTGLTDGTKYQFQALAKNATGDSAASDTSDAVAPADETLTASSVESATATLTMDNYSGNWRYKANAAPDNTCKGPVSTTTKNLTGLSGNTSYTYKAYSDSSCNTELAAASAFLTKPGKPTKPAATSAVGSGNLTITASVTGAGTLTGWKYAKSSDNYASWSEISSTSKSLSHTVTGLTDGTNYQFKVRAVNATGDGVASDASVAAAPVDETLTASSVTHNSATLTIGNHSGNWYYKANAAPDASCSSTAVSTTTKNLTGLSGNTNYTYTAYSDNGCSDALQSATFLTKPGQPTGLTVTSGAGSGKLTISATVTGDGAITGWKYQKKSTGSFGPAQPISNSASTSLSYTVTELTDDTKYQFKVQAVNATGAGQWSAPSSAAAPTDETLAATSVTHNSATLTIGNHTGDWYYKANAAPHASCSSTKVTGKTVDLTGLTSNTGYTYRAYSDSNCSSTKELVSATLLTKPGKPTKPTATAGAGSGKLTITASVTGGDNISKWQYQQKEGSGNFGSWQEITSTNKSLSYTVSGLTDNTSYQFKVKAFNATGEGEASDASDAVAPKDETLTVNPDQSNVTAATLAIANYTGDWYYKANTGPHSSCQGPVRNSNSVDLSGLSGNTSYTYTAHSDSSCQTSLAAASEILTKPGKPQKPTATAGAGTGKLTLASIGDRHWRNQQVAVPAEGRQQRQLRLLAGHYHRHVNHAEPHRFRPHRQHRLLFQGEGGER